jgi:hypothetical protein
MSRDTEYFLSRAEEEDRRAAETDNDFAKDAHHRLAEIYRQTAHNRGPRALNDYQIGSSELFIL